MPLFLVLLLAQVGPLVSPGAAPALPHETTLPPPRTTRGRPAALPVTPEPSRQQLCLTQADATPGDAEEAARAWLATAQADDKALAGECLGVALSRQEQWGEASAAFIAARDSAVDKGLRARLGAMAGNAALAQGDAATALTALDGARSDALGDAALSGDIALDRARALVPLKRDGEADAALAEARAAQPGNAQAWLLSATLSRRLGKLAQAQAQIEKAAELLPVDPEIGLEAGVIAVLAGRDEAARRSWRSVLAAAPQSDAAATARGYLTQLDPTAAVPAGAAKP